MQEAEDEDDPLGKWRECPAIHAEEFFKTLKDDFLNLKYVSDRGLLDGFKISLHRLEICSVAFASFKFPLIASVSYTRFKTRASVNLNQIGAPSLIRPFPAPYFLFIILNQTRLWMYNSFLISA